MDILVVSQRQFQLIVFFGVLLVLASVACTISLMPATNDSTDQTVESEQRKFEQQKFEYTTKADESGLEVLRDLRLQRMPDIKPQSRSTKKKSKVETTVPSEGLKMKGVFIDSRQPMNAIALIESNIDEKWFGIGDHLSGKFAAWSIQSISRDGVHLVSGDAADTIPLSIDEEGSCRRD